MKELSLNVLDIIENSVNAHAENIDLIICENTGDDVLTITVSDDGRGMDAELLEKACDPFATTNTRKKVGLGLPLLKEEAEMCGGRLTITSKPGQGTVVSASFVNSHVDRPPIGDITGTVTAVIAMHPGMNFSYSHTFDGRTFTVTTMQLREIMDPVPLNDPAILKGIQNYVQSNLDKIREGR
jgi:hypothetical protein